ncbi:hypothetical protein CNR22_10335 [Sphingobacteriaceae bacterium]|nr:hypothetical protein CNR22_10335 [Sphingobacteriaceae bacterium]
MKKKIVIGLLVGVVSVASVLFSCKKETEEKVVTSKAIEQNESFEVASRLMGSKVYYSKNKAGTVYKLVVTGSAEGTLSVDRSVYRTTRPDTIKKRIFFSPEVHYTGLQLQPDGNYKGKAATITIPNGKKYYYIPFTPGLPTHEGRPVEGGYEVVCYSCCDQSLTDWTYDCAVFGNTKECCADCMSLKCDDCEVICYWNPGKASPFRVYNDGGGLIIEGESVNIVH